VKTLWLAHTAPGTLDRLQAYSPPSLTACASVLLDLADAVGGGRMRLPTCGNW
jgi:hypothetical protein